MSSILNFRNIWSSGFFRKVCVGSLNQCSAQWNQISFRSICLIPSPITAAFPQNCFTPSTGTVRPSGKCSATCPQVAHQSIRTKTTGKRIYYRGSAWKRYNKHNIEKRLITDGGLEILWRKALKGKHQLAVYERILPNTVDGKILPDHLFKFQKHPLTKNKLPKPGLF